MPNFGCEHTKLLEILSFETIDLHFIIESINKLFWPLQSGFTFKCWAPFIWTILSNPFNHKQIYFNIAAEFIFVKMRWDLVAAGMNSLVPCHTNFGRLINQF